MFPVQSNCKRDATLLTIRPESEGSPAGLWYLFVQERANMRVQLVDHDAIRNLMEFRGISARRLAIVSGRGHFYVNRLLNGEIENEERMDLGGIVAIAEALDVSIDELLLKSYYPWKLVDRSDKEAWEQYFDCADRGKSRLLCARWHDSYLLTNQALESVERTKLAMAGNEGAALETAISWAMHAAPLRIKSRTDHDYQFVVVGPENLFLDLAFKDSVLADFIADRMKLDRKVTALGLVPDEKWKDLDADIRIATGRGAWDKVYVIDETVATMLENGTTLLRTYHRQTVIKVRAAISGSARYIPYTMPTVRRLSGSDFTAAHSGFDRYLARMPKNPAT